MKDFLRNIKINAVLSAIICVVLGLVLVIWPEVVGTVFCYVVGAALVLSGVAYIVSYLRQRDNASLFQVDFLMGLVFAVLGVWIIAKPDMILSLIPVLCGIVILLHGFMVNVSVLWVNVRWVLRKQCYKTTTSKNSVWVKPSHRLLTCGKSFVTTGIS